MSDETKTAAPSDEQLGAALRKIAEANGQTPDGFAYYANNLVAWSDNIGRLGLMAQSRIDRVKVFVQPPGRFDGVLEHTVEMLAGHNVQCAAADPFCGNDGNELMSKFDADNCSTALAVQVERLKKEVWLLKAHQSEQAHHEIKLRAILEAETERRTKAESQAEESVQKLADRHEQLARATDCFKASWPACIERVEAISDRLGIVRSERDRAKTERAKLKAKLDRLVAVLSEAERDA